MITSGAHRTAAGQTRRARGAATYAGPAPLEVGRASALFVHGAALSGTGRPADVELVVNGRGVRALAEQMPSPPGSPRSSGWAGRRRAERSSGASLPLGPGTTRLAVSATLPGGGRHRVSARHRRPRPPAGPAGAGVVTDPARTVAICMATLDPPPELFGTRSSL